jgi:ribonucleoside-diphosphate reductase alpha chain
VSSKKEVRIQSDDKNEGDKREYTEEEVKACSIEAMMNGEECEACQ